jgi:hypothetical protein
VEEELFFLGGDGSGYSSSSIGGEEAVRGKHLEGASKK